MGKLLNLVLLLGVLTGCFSNYQIAFVNANSGLRVKSAPEVTAKKIAFLPFKQEVKIVHRNNELINVDGYENNWVKIQSGGVVGWVFGGYLSSKHPDELPPGANSYTGFRYSRLPKSLTRISSRSLNEDLFVNLYEANQKYFFGFLERKKETESERFEWEVLHGITLDKHENEDITPGNFQCVTPSPEKKEIFLGILTATIRKTGSTIGNHYELSFDKLKVRKAWILSKDETYFQPILKTKGILCVIPDPANELKAVSE